MLSVTRRSNCRVTVSQNLGIHFIGHSLQLKV